MLNPKTLPKNVTAGTFAKYDPASDADEKQRLVAENKIDEACVVFTANRCNNNTGLYDKEPVVVMFHWSMKTEQEFKSRLEYLFVSAADDQDGIGSLNRIKMYIISHTRNTIGFNNDLRKELANLLSNSKLLIHDDLLDDDDISENTNDELTVDSEELDQPQQYKVKLNKINIHQFDTFIIHNMGNPKSIKSLGDIVKNESKDRSQDTQKVSTPNPLKLISNIFKK